MSTEALVRSYQAAYGTIREQTELQATQNWQRLGGLSDAATDAFTGATVPVVYGAQQATTALVNAYMTAMTRDATGTAGRVPTGNVGELRGVDLETVYRRPTIEARTAISKGESFDEAMSRGRTRAGLLAGVDVLLAQRAAAAAFTSSDNRIIGYRRVLTGKSCALCATASTQRYHSGSLMPIHPRCDCSVSPIYATTDAGKAVNDRVVAGITSTPAAAAAGRHLTVSESGVVRLPAVTVREHGELGPVLTISSDAFTGPGDIPA